MKRFSIITETDARALEYGSTVELARGGHVTPLAADTLRDRRVSVVFVEHVIRAVVELSDRVVVLNEGEVIAVDRPAAAMRDPRVIAVYLGRAHAA